MSNNFQLSFRYINRIILICFGTTEYLLNMQFHRPFLLNTIVMNKNNSKVSIRQNLSHDIQVEQLEPKI